MKHASADDAAKETAALYALGALTQLEASAFDNHLAEGCETCLSEVRSFDSVVGNLGLGAIESEPPSRRRQKLLSPVNNGRDLEGPEKPAAKRPHELKPQLFTVRADEGEWKE